jgi:hypothetical protein
MAEELLWTFDDVVNQLTDQWGVDLTGRNRRLARQAILHAYRELPQPHRWTYYDRRALLYTEATYSTGSVVYDHTGGTNERQLTLTGGTWPVSAARGRVVLGSVHFNIDSRISDTVVTLDPSSNPGQDVGASGYQWYRNVYPLPVNFRKLGRIWDIENENEIAIVTTDHNHATSINFYDTPDTPWQAVIRNVGEFYSGTSIEFGPPPASRRAYDYTYESRPRDLNIQKYSTGTLTMSSGASTFTISGGTLPVTCVGSILRLTTGAVEPTSVIGRKDTTGGMVDNPFLEQRVIVERTNDTSGVVDDVVLNSYTGKKYTISDPIDLDISAMFNAFYRLAEAEFARLTRHEKETAYRTAALQAVRNAMENDQRHQAARRMIPYNRFHHVTVTTNV